MSRYISCTATSVQLGSKRFPDRHERPQIKAWRCDLTALSRSRNFYFVACNDTIHVYQPKFPDQSMPVEPDLVLNPPISSPYLEPGIDYEDSHSITRLHMDYLGQDEIILITCDDGDVIGYRTEEIQRVLDKRSGSSRDEQELQTEDTVRTFLHRNVGASAWGLAIHQEARIIAISANTHKVTIIAFALAQAAESPDYSSDFSDFEWEDRSKEGDSADFPSPRRRDHVMTLSAHHNVPAVSFNNSGDDPLGRWLSSSSINGEALVWDLHQPKEPARVIRLGFCASVKDPTKAPELNPGGCACLRPGNFPHAVWSTMFLDASTAYEEPLSQDLTLQSQEVVPCFQDISGCKKRFGARSYKVSQLAMVALPNNAMSDNESNEMDVLETESNASEYSETHPLPSSQLSGSEQPYQLSESEASSNVDMYELQQTPHQVSPEAIGDQANTGDISVDFPTLANVTSTWNLAQPPPPPPPAPGNAINSFGVWFQPPGQNTATIVWNDDDDSGTDNEMFVSPTAQAHIAFANAVQPIRAYCEVITAPSFEKQLQISSPLLVVTKEDIHLYQRPLDYSGDHLDAIVTIRRPLHPVESENPWPLISDSHDRHCYTTQIPELGVFIIASPDGRAGILSLTKAESEAHTRPFYGFNLEYVLPFSNDDESKVWDVDGARLIGVAAGPVQGMLDRPHERNGSDEDTIVKSSHPNSRRWRLLMYYTDHTVLTFELRKRRVSETPEVGELII